jgi:hypothetical protein
MGESKTTRSKHLRDITQTQPPQDRQQDNVSRKLKEVKRRTGSFVKGTATVRAEERCVATFGFLRTLSGDSGSTMGTIHRPTLLVQLSF